MSCCRINRSEFGLPFKAAVPHSTQARFGLAPETYCEHPNWEPDFGAWYVSQVIDILASNPDVWSKTALFLTYDEEHNTIALAISNRASQIARVNVFNR